MQFIYSWTLLMHFVFRNVISLFEATIKKTECIFFNVDFISWMDFKIITIIMKLIVLVLCSLFILYDWTLELLRAWVTISDIIHSFAFSNYKIHKVLICGFISLILSTKERSNDSKTIKKTRELLNLIFKTIDTCIYFNKPKACDSQFKFFLLTLDALINNCIFSIGYFYDAHFIADLFFLFVLNKEKKVYKWIISIPNFLCAQLCVFFSPSLLLLFVYLFSILLFVPFNIWMTVCIACFS